MTAKTKYRHKCGYFISDDTTTCIHTSNKLYVLLKVSINCPTDMSLTCLAQFNQMLKYSTISRSICTEINRNWFSGSCQPWTCSAATRRCLKWRPRLSSISCYRWSSATWTGSWWRVTTDLSCLKSSKPITSTFYKESKITRLSMTSKSPNAWAAKNRSRSPPPEAHLVSWLLLWLALVELLTSYWLIMLLGACAVPWDTWAHFHSLGAMQSWFTR